MCLHGGNSRSSQQQKMQELLSCWLMAPNQVWMINCNDLQSKWPRPAIIAFFDRD
ncbi:hypothetical protein CFBP3846_05151 [Pseudomonas syringae pv. avii]|uniref:Uncharacterized protein n=1 Tax=Pseudomonas syringae pv. avii TaxID=663959 RepID=A0ABY1UDI3_PSESX|nr:hypothetical protein CFBP3846_05151 [Pseudomonas syringae pv. avii]